MKSIQTKIILFLLAYMILLTLAIGTASILFSSKLLTNDSKNMMTKVSQAQSILLNGQLELVEHAVDTIYGCAYDHLDDAERIYDAAYREEYTEFVRKIAVELSNHTDGALCVYFRYNPEVVKNGMEGFFYTRLSGQKSFESSPITDITQYGPEDMEYAGWYYTPVQNGKAMWMSLYHNQNVDTDMISYVIPFYKDSVLIGVIGMDVDFELLINYMRSVQVYENCQACLVDISGEFFYDKQDGQFVTVELPHEFYQHLASSKNQGVVTTMKYEGSPCFVIYEKLNNSMKSLMILPTKEVYGVRVRLVVEIVVNAAVVLVLAVFLNVFFSKRMIKPLKDLTYATEQFAEGNWDVPVECHTNDEIKQLTESIQAMAQKTQVYIARLNAQAVKDGLTGVRNKAGYLDAVEELKGKIGKEVQEFGVIVFDINWLKETNDNYGHEAGDKLIMQACFLICKNFSHSPVFRVGGDEFVAILQEHDFKNRERLLKDFDAESCSMMRIDEEREIKVSVAQGVAVYPEDGKSFDEIFAVADKRMYERKKSMKGGQKPR